MYFIIPATLVIVSTRNGKNIWCIISKILATPVAVLPISSIPETGNSESFIENKLISSNPTKKSGIDIAINANTEDAESNIEYCFVAATTPIGMAITITAIVDNNPK